MFLRYMSNINFQNVLGIDKSIFTSNLPRHSRTLYRPFLSFITDSVHDRSKFNYSWIEIFDVLQLTVYFDNYLLLI